MGKKLGAALVSAALIAAGTTSVRAEVSNPLPGGATLTVDIDSPVDGAVVESGTPLTVTGTASVGEAPALKNTDLVFVIDTSGSTNDGSGLACGTILACEKAAVLQIVDQAKAARSPISNIGLAAFPFTGVQSLVAPASTAIPTYVGGLTSSGTTNFSSGITRARQILDSSVAQERLIVLLTDGEGTVNPGEAPIAAVILAFTIGGQECTPPLETVVDLGDLGSECAVVTDLANLSGVIEETIGSSLDTIEVTVDDVVVHTASPSIPGPGSASFTTTVNGLTLGEHEICATASGHDAVGSASVEECVDINVVAPGTVIVDCEGTSTCTATAQDPGKSSLLFTAPPAFDETVTIIPGTAEPGDCGGANCRTGYDVVFPTTSATGPIASLSVTTANRVSIADRLKAAVYMDDVRITAQCSNRIIIKIIRDRLGRPEPIPCITISYKPSGQVEYFVKFRADPGFRFR